ncbi:uncharacterized protein LOC134842976 [Symsagittifera roscoffensis]|uniref:uncharacterized protein LOC134842976 n=1 Tax=Symsagittifera roscoffensis TaxID=84072 RepID=UPI00307B555E
MALTLFELCVTAVFGFVGISAGCLVMFVLTYKRKPSASERLVVGLSLSEVSFNVFYILIIAVRNSISITNNPADWFKTKIFLSIDYFLFGFCLISSYLLVFAATISRYYAICRIHEFKKMFNKKRVNRLIGTSFVAGFLQACINASYKWVPPVVQTMIDIEYAAILGIFLTVDSIAMLLVYIRVISKFEELRKRLGIDPNERPPTAVDEKSSREREPNKNSLEVAEFQKQVTLNARTHLAARLSVAECPHSCSRLPSAAEITNVSMISAAAIAARNTKDAIPTTSGNNNCLSAAPVNNNNNIEANSGMNSISREEKRENKKSRYHYSREVSFSLLLISIIYVACVTPFTLVYLLNQMGLVENPVLEAISRLVLQLKFVLNPIAYTRSSTFRNRFKRIWHNLRYPKETPIPNTPSPNKHQRVSSLRRFFGSNNQNHSDL